MIAIVSTNKDRIGDFIGDFWKQKKAAECEDLVVKLIAYTECEESPGCTITLEEYEGRTDLILKIARDCQNP